jgi:hypothetical protein
MLFADFDALLGMKKRVRSQMGRRKSQLEIDLIGASPTSRKCLSA